MPDMPTYNPPVLAVSVEGRDGPLSKSSAVGASHPNLGDFGDWWGLRGPWKVQTGWDGLDGRLATPDVFDLSAECNLRSLDGSCLLWSPAAELAQKPGRSDSHDWTSNFFGYDAGGVQGTCGLQWILGGRGVAGRYSVRRRGA